MKLNARPAVYAYLIYTLLPAVAYFTRGYMLMLITVYILMLFWYRHGRYAKLPVLLVPFLCMYVMDVVALVARGEFSAVQAYSMLTVYLPVFLGLAVMEFTSRQASKLFKMIMLLQFFVAISSVIVLAENPNASRYLATGERGSYADSLYMRNTADYTLVYTMAISLPLMSLASREGLIKKWSFVVYATVISVMVVYANYAMAIMVLLVALLVCFLPPKTHRGQMLVMMTVVALVLLVLPEHLARLIETLGDMMQNPKVAQKFKDVAMMLRGQEVGNRDTAGRIELYRYSWEKFLESPVVGHWYKSAYHWGGHSFILDTAAKYGIAGVALLVFLYRAVYKYVIAPLRNEVTYVPVLMTFFLALVVSALNTGMWINVTVLYVAILVKAVEPAEKEGNGL